MEVSWQVAGMRKDPFTEANRVQVEVDESPDERGLYLHPGAFGLPDERGISFEARQEHQRKLDQFAHRKKKRKK